MIENNFIGEIDLDEWRKLQQCVEMVNDPPVTYDGDELLMRFTNVEFARVPDSVANDQSTIEAHNTQANENDSKAEGNLTGASVNTNNDVDANQVQYCLRSSL